MIIFILIAIIYLGLVIYDVEHPNGKYSIATTLFRVAILSFFIAATIGFKILVDKHEKTIEVLKERIEILERYENE